MTRLPIKFELEIVLVPTLLKLSNVHTMQEGLELQDNLDIALDLLLSHRAMQQVILAETQNNMRSIQRTYFASGDKPTVVERAYKVDEAHSHLEALLTETNAAIAYCDGYISLIEGKSFKLSTLLKGL